MAGIFKILAFKENQLETGIVQSKTKTGYSVKVGSFTSIMTATTSESLPNGSKVLIGQSNGKRYILGKDKLNSDRIREVRVNG